MIDLPITLTRRGMGMRIVIDSPFSQPEPDKSLIDLVARAHVCLDLMTGPHRMGTTEIAAHLEMDRADVGRILPLEFLSPKCLKAILEGR